MKMFHPDLKDENGLPKIAEVIESAFRDVWSHRGWLEHREDEAPAAPAPSAPVSAPGVTSVSTPIPASNAPQGGVTGPGDSK